VQIQVLFSEWEQYELLDSGNQRKLERFGDVLLVRGEPRAWWKPGLPEREWARAVAVHDDRAWSFKPGAPREWTLDLDGMEILCRFSETSKHVGVFPEQWPHWQSLCEFGRPDKDGKPKLLNLFGYTGVATLCAARAGFDATHVDASKPTVAWARRNHEISGLGDVNIRYLLDDALKFVKREVRRGNRYEAILLDPPAFGRGPRKELWKVEAQVAELLADCAQLLSDRARLLILTMYNTDASALMLNNLLTDALEGKGGRLSIGELALRHTSGPKILPRSLWARWQA
jgi:23S rRNA (cytosine1962-C5)-methyltransferase